MAAANPTGRASLELQFQCPTCGALCKRSCRQESDFSVQSRRVLPSLMSRCLCEVQFANFTRTNPRDIDAPRAPSPPPPFPRSARATCPRRLPFPRSAGGRQRHALRVCCRRARVVRRGARRRGGRAAGEAADHWRRGERRRRRGRRVDGDEPRVVAAVVHGAPRAHPADAGGRAGERQPDRAARPADDRDQPAPGHPRHGAARAGLGAARRPRQPVVGGGRRPAARPRPEGALVAEEQAAALLGVRRARAQVAHVQHGGAAAAPRGAAADGAGAVGGGGRRRRHDAGDAGRAGDGSAGDDAECGGVAAMHRRRCRCSRRRRRCSTIRPTPPRPPRRPPLASRRPTAAPPGGGAAAPEGAFDVAAAAAPVDAAASFLGGAEAVPAEVPWRPPRPWKRCRR